MKSKLINLQNAISELEGTPIPFNVIKSIDNVKDWIKDELTEDED